MAQHAKPLDTEQDISRFVDKHDLSALRRQLGIIPEPKHAGVLTESSKGVPEAHLLWRAGFHIQANRPWYQSFLEVIPE